MHSKLASMNYSWQFSSEADGGDWDWWQECLGLSGCVIAGLSVSPATIFPLPLLFLILCPQRACHRLMPQHTEGCKKSALGLSWCKNDTGRLFSYSSLNLVISSSRVEQLCVAVCCALFPRTGSRGDWNHAYVPLQLCTHGAASTQSEDLLIYTKVWVRLRQPYKHASIVTF